MKTKPKYLKLTDLKPGDWISCLCYGSTYFCQIKEVKPRKQMGTGRGFLAKQYKFDNALSDWQTGGYFELPTQIQYTEVRP